MNYTVKKLYETRRKFELPRSIISRFLKVPETTIWRWENSISEPSPNNLLAINKLVDAISELQKDILNEKS